jgi:hypothetical protein
MPEGFNLQKVFHEYHATEDVVTMNIYVCSLNLTLKHDSTSCSLPYFVQLSSTQNAEKLIYITERTEPAVSIATLVSRSVVTALLVPTSCAAIPM